MKNLLFTTCFLGILAVAKGQDRVFNYTYQSIVLNQGQREIEVWNTLRTGRDGFYRGLDSRIEFEFGVAKNLQAAFYLNMGNSSFEQRYEEVGEEDQVTIESEMEWSFSNEWKYKMSDPVANSIGSALYAEIGVGTKEMEIEAKLILDKKIGRVTQALNLVAEPEWETEVEIEYNSDGSQETEVENEFEFKFEFDYGLSYNINPNWNIGFEVVNRNKVEEGEWETSVLHAGPGFSYVRGPVWINLTVLPQISGLKYPGENQSGLLLDGYEKVETRLVFSYGF
ncbi:MAG TPA: hypothetical protein PKD91_04655 [Bacteroidia bacterium]|nr:hypothetical protein [Bacteroidia bacterium]